MSGQASYVKKVLASADDSQYYELPAANVTLNMGATVLDVTEMDTNAGFKNRILGLLDSSITLDMEFVGSHSGIGVIKTALTSRTTIYLKVLPNGTAGYKVPVVVESINQSGSVEDKEKMSVSLQGNGAWSEV